MPMLTPVCANWADCCGVHVSETICDKYDNKNEKTKCHLHPQVQGLPLTRALWGRPHGLQGHLFSGNEHIVMFQVNSWSSLI